MHSLSLAYCLELDTSYGLGYDNFDKKNNAYIYGFLKLITYELSFFNKENNPFPFFDPTVFLCFKKGYSILPRGRWYG